MSDNVVRFEHDPVGMLEEVVERSKGKRWLAGFVVMVDENDEMVWDNAAFQRKDLLWALEKIRHRLMNGDDL